MTPAKRRNLFIILILGALMTVTPFSIDMYLPAFTQIAADFHTTSAEVSLSLSSYFIGMALGQILYGPLLDRFGRKPPLYVGLGIFILMSIACMQAHDVNQLVLFRFFQALGGSAAGVACMAMVRDFFPVEESARILSLLMLILGVSPLFAPTVGSLITTTLGWKWVFIMLTVITLLIAAAVRLWLPDGYAADKSVSLKPLPIIHQFVEILKVPQFYTYSLSGAFSFAGLLVYVGGSPIIFMEVFHVSPRVYGGIFALLATGFIGSNQVNIMLSRHFSAERIYRVALCVQCGFAIIFLIGILAGWFGLIATVALFFCCLSCLGLTYPNASALALAPFTRNLGSAAALIGFLQIGIGSLATAGVGIFNSVQALPVIAILTVSSLTGLVIFVIGHRRIGREIEPTPEELIPLH